MIKNYRWVMNGRQEDIGLQDLYAACRSQSSRKLGELAIKIEPRYGWEDLILPEDRITQLLQPSGLPPGLHPAVRLLKQGRVSKLL